MEANRADQETLHWGFQLLKGANSEGYGHRLQWHPNKNVSCNSQARILQRFYLLFLKFAKRQIVLTVRAENARVEVRLVKGFTAKINRNILRKSFTLLSISKESALGTSLENRSVLFMLFPTNYNMTTQGRSQGSGPGVPVTPPFANFF